jgi:K+-sensing histidine kinase KdpD
MRTPPLIYFDIPALRPGTVGAYAFAFACTAVATVLRLAIDPYIMGVHYVTLFPAVIITTLIGGVGAGLFSLGLSVGAAAFFILPPRFSFYIENLSDVLLTLLFILITLVLIIVIGGMRFTIERHKETDRELERRRKEVDRELEEHRVALREREDRLSTVVGELQHRTRNLLSVVGTIADNTMRKSSTFADFGVRYHDRLEALARVQGLLSVFCFVNKERVAGSHSTNSSRPSLPRSLLMGEMVDGSSSRGRKALGFPPAQSRRLRWLCTS